MQWFKKINWTVGLFITLVPLVGIGGLIWWIKSGHYHGATLIFAAMYTYVTGVAITAGYHRLFSHRAYKANRAVRVIMALLGSSNFEGSVMEWSTDHRRHHLYTDTDRDPYSIKKGFFYAHMGWLYLLDSKKRDFSNVDDLASDPFIFFCHKYFVPVAIGMGFILPALIASLWGDFWGGLLIAGALRIAFNQQVTFCINSVCHVFGKKTYSDKQSACDNWLTALLTYGEGFHNYHHQFPLDYRNGVRFFHYDPAKWVIKCLSYFGWATELRMMKPQKVMQYQMRLDEKRLKESEHSATLIQHINDMIAPLRDKAISMCVTIEDLEAKVNELKHAYHDMKHNKLNQMKEAMDECKQSMQQCKAALKQTKRELKDTLNLWHHIVKTSELKACQ